MAQCVNECEYVQIKSIAKKYCNTLEVRARKYYKLQYPCNTEEKNIATLIAQLKKILQ